MHSDFLSKPLGGTGLPLTPSDSKDMSHFHLASPKHFCPAPLPKILSAPSFSCDYNYWENRKKS